MATPGWTMSMRFATFSIPMQWSRTTVHAILSLIFPRSRPRCRRSRFQSLAKVADRFELIVSRVELANGYNELLDPKELELRISQDNRKREQASKSFVVPDERLLAAMRHGLPQCSGVSIGLDRLISLALGFDNLSQVMTFPAANA